MNGFQGCAWAGISAHRPARPNRLVGRGPGERRWRGAVD